MNKHIEDQKAYNDAMFSTKLEDIFHAPDDTFRAEKQQAAESGDPQAQAWVDHDATVDGLERRIGQYDHEIQRRQDPTHVLKLEEHYQSILHARSVFLENNPKPLAFGKDEWQKKFSEYEQQIEDSKQQMHEWEEKSSPEVLAELTKRRNQKFEELLEATGERQKLGELPSEQLMHAQASADAYNHFQGRDSFSLAERIQKRRETSDGDSGQSEQGERQGGMAWAAETLAKPTEEEKLLADLQHKFVLEKNRWPKEKEIDDLLFKHQRTQNGHVDVESEEQTQVQTQRRSQTYTQ
ncbi:TPA: hypothetical protein QEN11_07680 [Stenotrophomonas maltophilia]|nr:hypothetical protein [Stenotrophomonas maltophilia]